MSGVGLPGYAKAYAAVKTPRTVAEVAQYVGCGKPSISLLFRALHARGLMHVVGWTNAAPRCMQLPIWALGDGQDAPKPPRGRDIHRTKRLPVNIVAFVELIESMSMGPHTRDELGQASGLHFHTLRRVLDALHKCRMVYISDWQPSPHGTGVRVYSLGDKRDKPYPRKSKAAINADFRARQDIRRLCEAMA